MKKNIRFYLQGRLDYKFSWSPLYLSLSDYSYNYIDITDEIFWHQKNLQNIARLIYLDSSPQEIKVVLFPIEYNQRKSFNKYQNKIEIVKNHPSYYYALVEFWVYQETV